MLVGVVACLRFCEAVSEMCCFFFVAQSEILLIEGSDCPVDSVVVVIVVSLCSVFASLVVLFFDLHRCQRLELSSCSTHADRG